MIIPSRLVLSTSPRLQSSVISAPNAGMIAVIPVVTATDGVTAPEYKSFPVPLASVPIPKCVTVVDPPEQTVKVTAFVFFTELPETVH
jgi:hypothetical protein